MSDDTEICIALAVSLEKERALKIVQDVSEERIGGKGELMPTAFHSGYQLACEEIEHRLKTEEWGFAAVVIGDAPNAPGKPTAANEPNEGENT